MLTPIRFAQSLLFMFFIFSAIFAQAEKPTGTAQTGSTVTASATGERVRFTAPGTVVRLQLEVFSDSGQVLFDAATKGNVLDWTVQNSTGQQLSDGTYLCVVTVKSLSGSLRQKIGLVVVHDKQVSLRAADAALLTAAQQQAVGPLEQHSALTFLPDGEAPTTTVVAHDGTDGQLTRARGALSFRVGDFFSGKDQEQMRLTEEGNLGIGTDAPEAKLDVNGMIRTRGGIQFADGSVLNLAPRGGGLRITLPSGETASVNLPYTNAPSAVAAITQNRIPKFADGGGTLTDSALYEAPNGFIGWGTTTPPHPFSVRRNGATVGVHSIGELFVDRDNNSRSASVTVGTAGVLKWIFGMPFQSDGFQIFDLTNNASRLFVNPTNGNVGIGTNQPDFRLNVLSPGFRGLRVQTDTPGGNVASFGGYGAFQVDAPFFPGGRLTIKEDGKVGLGTNAPLSWLHVNTPSSPSPISGMAIDVQSFQTFSNAQASHFFRVRDVGSGAPSAFYIRGDGNVGVGTESPAERLSVVGRVESTAGGFKFPDGSVQTTALGATYSTTSTAATELTESSVSILHLNLPQGAYILSATVELANLVTGLGSHNRDVACRFSNDQEYFTSVGEIGWQTVSYHSVAFVLNGQNGVDLFCRTTHSSPSNIFANKSRLTAVKFESLTVQ